VLEASALPRPPITTLGKVIYKDKNGPDKSSFKVEVAAQTGDELKINGNPTAVPCKADSLLKPFVLFIDDVLDPGNVGAIIRSAYFLGVDAIVLSSRTCAPITPVALKASAGAAEALPILSVDNPAEFLRTSTKNGWKVYCGTTPKYASGQRSNANLPSGRTPNRNYNSWAEQPQTRYTLSADGSIIDPNFSPIRFAPTILVVGGEGKGLRTSLTHNAYAYVEILPQIDVVNFGVDSLNVSVAAALLCADIVRPRPPVVKKPPKAVRPMDTPTSSE
jgi:21S rRNA (GM2251-2'-O)-methyltransferase